MERCLFNQCLQSKNLSGRSHCNGEFFITNHFACFGSSFQQAIDAGGMLILFKYRLAGTKLIKCFFRKIVNQVGEIILFGKQPSCYTTIGFSFFLIHRMVVSVRIYAHCRVKKMTKINLSFALLNSTVLAQCHHSIQAEFLQINCSDQI